MPFETSEEQINFFARTNFRNREVPFGIKPDDRRRHMYLIGKTGMGKTTLMENMAIQDIRNGHGVCFMDPHGDSVVKILDFIPNDRVNDVVYFNPADLEYPIAFNIMESVESRFKHLVSSGLMSVFTKIWANMWSARMEYILGNTIRALLDSPNNTMLGISRMYIDKQYRKRIVDNIKDPMVKMFWTDEYANYDAKWLKEAISPIQNKVGQFLSSAIIRNIVGQPKSTIDLRDIMDNRKILLMDLSKGKVGEENAALLGAMIITKLQLAAMSRVDMAEEDRPDFYLYVDEFQNFATESFATILSEARKYHLNLVMGHQYIGQLTPTKDNTRLKDAIFGNVGTMICFRIGASDAEYLETEFAPTYTPNDLVNLPKYNIILKLMINGVASEPFSARSIAVNPEFRTGNAEKVIRVSRERYGNNIDLVEERIARWMGAEFHQRSATLATAESDEEIALLQPTQPEKVVVLPSVKPGVEARIERVPEPEVAKTPQQADPAPAAQDFELEPEDGDWRDQAASDAAGRGVEIEQGGVDSQREPVTAPQSGPLVYKMPDLPKPAPQQNMQRSGPGSNNKQGGGNVKFGNRGDRQQQPRQPATNHGHGPSGGKNRNQNRPGSRKPQPQRSSGKPNIWDMVETIHEEKEAKMADTIHNAFHKPEHADHKAKPKIDAPQPRSVPEQKESAAGKVVQPGEVHKFE